MHIRQKIRNALGDVLLTVPELNGRVYMSRVYPYSTAKLPGATISFASESLDESIRATAREGREIFRTAVMDVSISLKGYDSDNEFDNISAKIESAVYASDAIRCVTKDWVLSSTDIEVLGEAENPVTMGTMHWSFLYANIDTNPEEAR